MEDQRLEDLLDDLYTAAGEMAFFVKYRRRGARGDAFGTVLDEGEKLSPDQQIAAAGALADLSLSIFQAERLLREPEPVEDFDLDTL
jgi:hypothetical protein